MLVQEYAIYSGEESFTPGSFHVIASRKMRLTLEMRRALLSGKDINLQQYLDLTPFRASDFRNTITQDMDPPEPPAPAPVQKHDIRELAVQALLAFGLDRPSAAKHVDIVLIKNPGYTHSSIVARNAYDRFLQTSADTGPPPESPVLSDSYAENLSLGYIGL